MKVSFCTQVYVWYEDPYANPGSLVLPSPQALVSLLRGASQLPLLLPDFLRLLTSSASLWAALRLVSAVCTVQRATAVQRPKL